MAKPNSEYWQERFDALNENLLNKGEDYSLRMISAYDEASQSIQKEIELFYARFATNNEISLSHAKKILSSDERKSFQMTLEEYIRTGKQNALDGKWIREVESASDIYRWIGLKLCNCKCANRWKYLRLRKSQG